jgi:hypothetical protein
MFLQKDCDAAKPRREGKPFWKTIVPEAHSGCSMRLRRIGDGDDVSEIGATSQSRGCHAAPPMTPAVFAGMASAK